MNHSRYISQASRILEELAACSFESMRLIHHPPHRSLYGGGAGIVYAFWRSACFFDEPRWLHHARLWIDHVAAAPEDNSVQQLPEDIERDYTIQIQDSLFFGNRGVFFVQALVGHAEDNQPLFERGLRAFTAPEAERLSVQELLQGIAGRLVGCALLLRETGDQRLRGHGDALAEDLLASALASKGTTPWYHNHRLGLAHGRAGNYYALLLWSMETGFALPQWVIEGLQEYAQSARERDYGVSWPIDERDERQYMNSWCNGAPGLILLWTLAEKLYGDSLFFETARASADYIVNQRDHVIGHLCCGAAGVAYAFLAMYHIDPDGPWFRHATHYADLSLKGMMDRHFRLSLFKGLAGIVCLMIDMESPDEVMLPGAEG